MKRNMPTINPPMKGDPKIINALNELRALLGEGKMVASIGRPEGWPAQQSQDLSSQYNWQDHVLELE